MEQIIDGIDVSGCEFLQDEEEYGYTCYAEEGSTCAVVNCSALPNCYYKQLKRKEKECEELKKTVMTKCPQCGEYLSPVGLELYEKINNYKQAIDEIENYITKYCNQCRNEYGSIDYCIGNDCDYFNILQIIQKVKAE